ncbi:MAG: LTA synthase family protein [Proteobacteria bacterium]|nr:LTA synthase family protein [Pseudomonadota bacterium]
MASISYFLMPVLVMLYFPVTERAKIFFRIIFIIFYFWLLFLIVYLFIDLIYYQFSLRHLSFEVLNAGGEIGTLFKIGLSQYRIELIILVIYISLVSYSYLRIFKEHYFKSRFNTILSNVVNFVLLLACLVIFSRGGLQWKPIKLSDAFVFDEPSLGHLCLNGFYTSLKTIYEVKFKKNKGKYENFKCSSTDLSKIKGLFYTKGEMPYGDEYPILRKFDYKEDEFRKYNVVIFIMESWSGKFVRSVGGKIDTTPFFDSLAKKGLLLKNFFANGQRSIEGISAIITSIPPWNGMILSENPILSQTRVNFLPQILANHGYETIFIHGARYGSMGLSGFARHAGFKKYFSKEDLIKMGGKDDGVWGIYDEDTFLIANKIFEKGNKPFFAVIFSLTSHTPYKVPSEKFKVFKKEQKYGDFLNSLYYSDYALSKFFEEAKKSSYFENTIFVILGDHTEGKTTKNSIYERFHVPCLFYAPSIISPKVIDITSSQLDVAPTILDLLKSNNFHSSFGQSVLRKTDKNSAILSYGDLAVYVKENYFLMTSNEKTLGVYDYSVKERDVEKGKNLPDVKRKLIEEFNCYGYFINKIIWENKIYPSKKINNIKNLTKN